MDLNTPNTFDHYDIYFQDDAKRYMQGFEAYEQFIALSNQEATGSGSGSAKKKRTYIPREREEAEQRLIDDYFGEDDTPPKYTEEYFRRNVRMKQLLDVVPSPAHKFVNTTRGSSFTEICFHDLPLDFSPDKDNIHEPKNNKVEDQQDVDGSKIIREVLPVEIGDTNLPWLKWEIGDISPFTSQTKEEKSRPRSALDMKKYVEIQNNEQLFFENWRERKSISSGGLLLCRNLTML
ncbi:hypothetical protein Tco_1099774 [Tanacetum coccineum]